tara:strand:- start:241 stop:615 length:375 start_codon:yes stop_codon:yes gene_type:complete
MYNLTEDRKVRIASLAFRLWWRGLEYHVERETEEAQLDPTFQVRGYAPFKGDNRDRLLHHAASQVIGDGYDPNWAGFTDLAWDRLSTQAHHHAVRQFRFYLDQEDLPEHPVAVWYVNMASRPTT